MDVPLENYLTNLSKGKAYRDNAFYFTTGIIDLMFSTWLLTAYTGKMKNLFHGRIVELNRKPITIQDFSGCSAPSNFLY